MVSLTKLPANATPDTVQRALNADGAVIVEGVLTLDEVSRAARELQPYFDDTQAGRNDFAGYRTKRIGALLARSATARTLALHPLVNALCDLCLSPFADGYQLHFTQGVTIGPGEQAQPLHRDRNLWGGQIPRRIETQVSTIWAISEFTAANGATQVVPGSHTWDDGREPEPDEICQAEMQPGSVLLYTGSVIHGGGKNETADRWRTGLLIHYTLNWLRQEENQYLSCPPDVAKSLSPELQALIGYSRGNGVLGFYSSPTPPGAGGVELADPRRLFDADAAPS